MYEHLCRQVMQSVEMQPPQPDRFFGALHDMAREIVGARLFTVTAVDDTQSHVRRLYTSDPAAYPTGGMKPLRRDNWYDTVMAGYNVFVKNTIEEISQVFPDYETIDALGCQSVINVPIIIAGKVYGTVNCLDVAHHYTQERVRKSVDLRMPAAVCLLALRHYQNKEC